jgi:hypothetical protein
VREGLYFALCVSNWPALILVYCCSEGEYLSVLYMQRSGFNGAAIYIYRYIERNTAVEIVHILCIFVRFLYLSSVAPEYRGGFGGSTPHPEIPKF